MESLANFYDLKFEKLIARYQFLGNGFSSKRHIESDSCLALGRPGVVVLLGKNGSGKTRFINGLKVFGEKKWHETPLIILSFSIPPIDEHIGYITAKEELVNSDEYLNLRADECPRQTDGIYDDIEEHEFDKKYLYLPFHDLIISSLVMSYSFSFRETFDIEKGEDVLDFFKFSEKEINRFKLRMSSFRAHDPSGYDPPRDNLNFRDYFPEFFLASLSSSVKDNNYVGPGSWFRHEKYLDDEVNRVKLVSGLRELFEGATHLELICRDGVEYISLVRRDEFGQDLSNLHQFLRNLRNEYENASFPIDLLEDESYPATIWLKAGGHTSPYEWRPFSVNDLTYHDRDSSISNIAAISRSFVKVNVESGLAPNYALSVSGLENLTVLLKQVTDFLKEIDIGITKVTLDEPDNSVRTTPMETIWFSEESNSHDFTPRIWLQDSFSKKWHDLAACSDGQLDVIRILINLCFYSKQYSFAQTKFLLMDEFDRHMHPVVAQQVLGLVDRFAKKYNFYVILSTHSFASLEVHKHLLVLADRDVNGAQRLSTNRHEDSKFLADQLGVPEIDIRKLKKLIMYVEGVHEEIIFNELLTNNNNFADIEIMCGNGLYGLGGFWRSQLQHENADVLIVYDKRNKQLEEAWENVQSKNERAKFVADLWENSKIKQLQIECFDRGVAKKLLPVPGDTELKTITFLLKDILKPNPNQAKSIRRVHLHGVEVPDIVDCLPIGQFQEARKYHSWEELREKTNDVKPSKFKSVFKINEASVARAVKNLKEWHPELQRLYNRTVGLLEREENFPSRL